ncbi:MAG: hypothetical protein ACO32Z_03020 [Gemmatimonadaceae bacterium]|jgi:hypothetical protein
MRRRAGIPLGLLIMVGVTLGLGACAGGQTSVAPLRPTVSTVRWPVKTRPHVDLWLHGYALLMEDTAQVPLFDRGYRERVTVAKNAQDLYTGFDSAARQLRTTLRARPGLEGAQFLALYFGSWDELQQAMGYFLKAEGDPARATNREVQGIVAFLAQQFPRAEDRDWARRFVAALERERATFFHAWWLAESRRRAEGLTAGDSLWQSVWRPRLQPFLNATQQQNGDLIPSMILGGEGRAVPAGKLASQYAVHWPTSAEEAEGLLFTFAHEAAGAVVQVAVNDHLTPAQQRAGAGARLGAIGLVRGGALLVSRLDPALGERYARFYLAQAGLAVPTSGALAALAEAFPMPEEMLASMRRQIDLAFGGI